VNMEGNNEAPQPNMTVPEAPQAPAFTPITPREIPSPEPQTGSEKGFLVRLAEKFGMLKQPETPAPTQDATPAPSGLAVETNAVDAFAANRTAEEIAALKQTRAALDAETQAQQPQVQAPTVSPAVQRMEAGQSSAKVTS
jgi:hypothetical protein